MEYAPTGQCKILWGDRAVGPSRTRPTSLKPARNHTGSGERWKGKGNHRGWARRAWFGLRLERSPAEPVGRSESRSPNQEEETQERTDKPQNQSLRWGQIKVPEGAITSCQKQHSHPRDVRPPTLKSAVAVHYGSIPVPASTFTIRGFPSSTSTIRNPVFSNHCASFFVYSSLGSTFTIFNSSLPA